MFRTLLVVTLVLGFVAFAGCSTKVMSYMEAATTEMVHPDGPITSFLIFGPWSEEFSDSLDHFEAHRRTYENDLHSLVDDWDRHFLRYDRESPWSE